MNNDIRRQSSESLTRQIRNMHQEERQRLQESGCGMHAPPSKRGRVYSEHIGAHVVLCPSSSASTTRKHAVRLSILAFLMFESGVRPSMDHGLDCKPSSDRTNIDRGRASQGAVSPRPQNKSGAMRCIVMRGMRKLRSKVNLLSIGVSR
jgi:hypothetical protein